MSKVQRGQGKVREPGQVDPVASEVRIGRAPRPSKDLGGVKKAAMSFDLVFKGTLSFVWAMSLRGLVGAKETV